MTFLFISNKKMNWMCILLIIENGELNSVR